LQIIVQLLYQHFLYLKYLLIAHTGLLQYFLVGELSALQNSRAIQTIFNKRALDSNPGKNETRFNLYITPKHVTI